MKKMTLTLLVSLLSAAGLGYAETPAEETARVWQNIVSGRGSVPSDPHDYWFYRPHLDPVPKEFALPFYPGSKALGSEKKGGSSVTVSLVSPEPVKPIYDFYRKLLQSGEWRLGPNTDSPDSVQFNAYLEGQAPGKEVAIQIQHRTPVTEISLTVTPRADVPPPNPNSKLRRFHL